MKILGNIKKSIGLMQATILLISSISIGLGLSAMEMRFALKKQGLEFKEQAATLVNLTYGGATSAAWVLDSQLAREVATGILSKKGVAKVEIYASLRENTQQLLTSLQQSQPDSNFLNDWIAKNYFSENSTITKKLVVPEQNENTAIGVLTIEFFPQHEADKFLDSAYSTLQVILLEACLIGLVLFFIAQWLITSPITRAASAISKIQPNTIRHMSYSVTIPKLHSDDELGLLLTHTNKLLDRLKDSQNKLHHLATRDALTGLPNRTLIQEHLSNMIATSRRTGSMVAVIFIDLDRFKTVNDSLGHEIGDKLLRNVAILLLHRIREEDAVGRLGGDEFLIIMPIKEVSDVVVMSRRLIQSFTHPFMIDSYELRTSPSLGISLYPGDGDDADKLMRCADLAMYKAKKDNSTQWQLFSEDMRISLEEGMALESALSRALEQNELEIYLQPKFYTQELKLSGCEALLRWKHDGKWIPPAKFIEIAEATGLIHQIGDWVIHETSRVIKNWGKDAVPISVNVSGQQLGNSHFDTKTWSTVKSMDIDPGLIEFEITETMLMHDLDDCLERLSSLRDRGFKISIDDFGTGYSSLSYLTRLPIDELKIDRSFVSGSERSPIVLSTIIAMGKALGIHVIAEGVETQEQLETLTDHGCDMIQGYLLGRPMPIEQFEHEFFTKKAQPD